MEHISTAYNVTITTENLVCTVAESGPGDTEHKPHLVLTTVFESSPTPGGDIEHVIPISV